MNDQERQIIADIFKRLEGVKDQPRDIEAERFIAEKLRAQPYAPYAMAQALYVQEEALKSLNEQMEQLRAENEQLQSRGSGGGGILSSIFGGGSSRQQPASFSRGQPGYGQGGQPGGYGPQGGPWGGPQGGPQQGGFGQGGGPWSGQPQAQPAGGGFLRGALTTAAGVAGGMVVGSALMNAFSGGGHSSLGSFSNADMASMGAPLGGAGVQDASFSDGGGAFADGGFSGNGGVQDASFDDGGGADFGGGDDSWT